MRKQVVAMSSSITLPTADITSAAQLPVVIPLFPLERALLLPRGHLPLNIFEKRYLAMINDALGGGRYIGMVQPRLSKPERPAGEILDAPPLYDVGALGRITSFSETSDGRFLISLFGMARFRIVSELQGPHPYRLAKVSYDEFVQDFEVGAGEAEVDRGKLIALLKAYLERYDIKADWKAIGESDNETLVNSLCMMCPYGVSEKQALLEAQTLNARNEILIAITELALGSGNGGTLQ
jgi:Lon protease-like protein